MTWGQKTQGQLTRAFVDLAEELDAGASAVGEGWRLALSEQPDLPLSYRDGRHPSSTGTHLAASVF